MLEDTTILKTVGISKSFPGVKALNKIDFALRIGEIHAIVGANGAGKSTFIKILAGFQVADEGEIYLQGKKVSFKNPTESIRHGIATVHQEIDVVKDLSVAANIFLGEEKDFVKNGVLNKKMMNTSARKQLDEIGLSISEKEILSNLSVANRQMVMIANALYKNSRILILDEPTSALSQNEINHLFVQLESLKERGVSIIYISHHFDEVFRIADRAMVLKDGNCEGTFEIKEISQENLIEVMIGKKLAEAKIDHTEKEYGETLLEVQDLHTDDNRVRGVSFSLKGKQVMGFYGIEGAGRTDIAKAIYTGKNIKSGSVLINGQVEKIMSPADSLKHGIAYSSESRKEEGLLLGMSIKRNISMSVMKDVSKLGVLNSKKETGLAEEYVKKLSIKAPSVNFETGNLSGGNQQKVVLGHLLATRSNVMILDEPTVGIDVAVKQEILKLIHQIALQGKTVMLISSEIEELMKICDNIAVMRMGKIEKIFTRSEFNKNSILMIATGGEYNAD